MKLPQGAEFIISRLNENGHRADIVGGCVRDRLLSLTPNDYDITTDATPEKMREIFSDVRTVDTGIKHGTLTVIYDSIPYEVTTYRLDGKYTDNRHPDTVSFTEKLSDDLSRRDFTVNAMCYNEKDGYTDLFFGMDDLRERIIRAVGDPVQRFSEDALRILRALRFSSTLDFNIEEKTASALFETKELLRRVSAERIFAEWKKLIAGVGAYGVLSKYAPIINVVIPEIENMKLPSEEEFDTAEPIIRELSLFATSCENPADAYDSAMQRLRADNKRRKFGEAVLESLRMPANDKKELLRLLIKYGEEVAVGSVKLRILIGECSESTLPDILKIIESDECYRISDMKVKGDDLLALGILGRDIGVTLDKVLDLIAAGKVKNERDELISYLKATLTPKK